MVLFGDMLEKSSYKQRQAVRHKVPVLRCEFITDCIEQKQILPTATYAVGEPISGKNFKKGRIGKNSRRFLCIQVSMYRYTIYVMIHIHDYFLI